MEQYIDVVYKLGSGSEVNNNELRYSLRSLENFLPLGNVFIVGFLPEWINKEEVTHIPAIDCYTHNKDANLCNKLILATIDSNLSEQFINMSDDQVFLQQCGYDEIKDPYIANHHIPKPSERPNRWQIRLMRTLDVLKERGLPQDCYESHLPCLLNKNDFASIVFQYAYGEERGYCGNTLYFNTQKRKGREIEPNTLCRLVDPITDRVVLEGLCSGKRYLNYTDKAINENLLLYLQRTFSTKSKYEK